MPLGESGGPAFLKDVAWAEMALEVEVIVDRGMDESVRWACTGASVTISVMLLQQHNAMVGARRSE